METPLITHISSEEFELIYEPAEDSFLLMDALEEELPFIQQLRPFVCVEIGCGSGVNITALANVLNDSLFAATDINPFACTITKRTAKVNNTSVDTIQMDLISCFRKQSIDLLIFNPPYVPTSDEELMPNLQDAELSGIIVKSWAGGLDGRRVIDRLLPQLDYFMSEKGVFYLLLVKENNPDEVIALLKDLTFGGEIIKERKIRGEHLFVLKIQRLSV